MFQWLKQRFGRPERSGQERYDVALREYLEVWRTAPTEEEHQRVALERFGLSEDDVAWVNQVLSSAALGTLENWATSQDDPWWQAARRLSRSRHRRLLRALKRSLTEE